MSLCGVTASLWDMICGKELLEIEASSAAITIFLSTDFSDLKDSIGHAHCFIPNALHSHALYMLNELDR
jgi:hypothetical protein